jgi:tripartite motif-containing protein 71
MIRRSIVALALLLAARVLSAAAPCAEPIRVWGKPGSGTAQHLHPTGIAVYRNPIGVIDVVMSDTQNHRVALLTGEGFFLDKWGKPGNSQSQLRLPMGLAITPQGKVLIADSGNQRIQVATGWADDLNQLIGETEASLGGDSGLVEPSDVAVGPDGRIYVVDAAKRLIVVLDSGGRKIADWNGAGKDGRPFAGPTAIEVSPTGRIFVTDTYSDRVVELDAEGRLRAAWGENGAGDGQLRRPHGLALDLEGNLYVVDSHNHRVQVFDLEGRFRGSFGSKGSDFGQLLYPHGIALDDRDRVYVTDAGNHRVQVFESRCAATTP